jgi:prepilin-type N-terminal cleavage/methylation domain-containing protein
MTIMAGHRCKPGSVRSGFTLVETTIALAIIALMVAVAIPLASSLGKAELRMAAGRASALIRSTYDEAALHGGAMRLLIDIDNKRLVPEAQEKKMMLPSADEDQEEQEKDEDKDDKDKKNLKDKEDAQSATIAGSGVSLEELVSLASSLGVKPADFGSSTSQAFDQSGEGYTFTESVFIDGFWAEHLDEEVRSGTAYLYFFPLGYSEHAILFLKEDGGKTYSLEVSPLTGRVTIHDDRIEIPTR